jgi:hypothetical protein
MYYLNGNHYPIASVFGLSVNGGSPSQQGSYLNNVTGIDDLSGVLGSYSLYPNPASDNLNLDVNLITGKKVEVKLFNSMGAEVKESLIYEGYQGDNRYKIDVQNLPQGIYFSQIMLDGVLTSTRQFIISR